MKKILSLLCISLLAFGLLGCQKKEEKVSVVGDWKLSDVTTINEYSLLEVYLENKNLKITFKEDGTCVIQDRNTTDETHEENSCKYTLEDKTITVTYESEGDEPVITPMTYNEGKLLIEVEEDAMIWIFSPVTAE